MSNNCLYVTWGCGYEYINLDDLHKEITRNKGTPGFNFYTREIRYDGKSCDYDPLLLSIKLDHNDSIIAFSLKYESPGKFRGGEIADGELGTASYKYENNNWACEWRWKSGTKEVHIPPCELLDTETQRTTRLAKQSMRNPSFRPMILNADGNRCVITGECQSQALDAAHILEVKSDGSDAIHNGITLRKDLHALFDAGLFAITSEGNCVPTQGLGHNYAMLLEGKTLHSNILDRVRQSLKERNEIGRH